MKVIKGFFKDVFDFIIPPIPTCVYCGKDNDIKDDYVCSECDKTREELRFKAERNDFFSCFYYDDIIKKCVWDYKYNRREFISEHIAEDILYLIDKNNINADFITNVPLHRKKKRKRGFDQAKEICLYLDTISGIPYRKMLKRIRNTSVQATLTQEERKQNVNNAFKFIYSKKNLGKSVIIIDDVYTTGATINSCKKELMSAGIEIIIPITFAKTRMPKKI
jgi:competence protein ComFC